MLATVNGKKPQTIISDRLSKAYDKAMAEIEASHGEASEAISNYWWNLYVIKRDNLWRAKYDEGHFKDWLADLSKEAFGPSKTDFYDTMGAVDKLKKLGKTEDEIHPLLGKLTTAIKNDLKLLFEKNGKGALLPEVQEQLEEDGLTPSEWVDSLSVMSPSDQRSEVLGKVRRTSIYFLEDATAYDEINGRLMANVQWETADDGIVYKGTVIITATEITNPRKHTKKQNYLPREVAEYIMQRLGISE